MKLLGLNLSIPSLRRQKVFITYIIYLPALKSWKKNVSARKLKYNMMQSPRFYLFWVFIAEFDEGQCELVLDW